ncbi:MAG TPA: hypothetical protein DCM60_03735 [Nitrospina sp.]|nr:hypothetical protein [Nitrospina sp.]
MSKSFCIERIYFMATKGNVKSDLLPLGFEIGFVIIANLLDGTKCKSNYIIFQFNPTHTPLNLIT